MPANTCQCYEEPIRNYYCYYDTPEGVDIDKKMMVTARYGVIAGLVLSTYDVLLHSHASGLGPILKRYAVHTIPLGLMGATFAGVANGLTIYRQKDDVYNYFLGGFACGPILAHYLGSKHAVLLGGIALGIAGVIKKNAIENCYTLTPNPTPHRNNAWKWRNDWTLAEDPLKEQLKLCAEKHKHGSEYCKK
ncbi:NADH dehydrogenase [ubiquinone] 1 alpha subcomplex subunit 11-like [Leguminivora glycinivorella]|uniref:NADH dehydrogenase [ubiquinone] 1 alpha subcomplex subunit 11-like n=1 Tax=Leguminivora glycinivorella TaxID=1035111 RepID=UPI00200E5CBD|nr:NADH dehydrogenase [ubiquinone] 1 alpha subcomplex subunit 11-like [Leguminivora glycinivorella]